MIYKDSSISWIGQIPIHWNTLSVSKAYQVTLGKMLQPNSNNENDVKTPYLKAMNVQDGYISLEKIDEMYCSANELKMLNLEVSDLVVCEGGEVARSAVVKEKLEGFIFQNSVHRVKSSEKGNTRFLHYLLIVLRASGFINILVNKATIAHFTKDKFNSLKIALPPLNEQIVISNYLDIKYDEVEILIKNKQKLITLLEQQRQSIITEAVTKGLNSNVKMKESGVEWIGEIPEHWEVRKIKDVGNVYSSNVDKKSVEGEKEVLLCNYVDVYYNDSITVNLDFMKATAKVDQIKIFTLKKHDVIITKDSESPTDIAIPTWVSQDLDGVVCGYHLSLIRCAESVLGHYLYYALESVQIREQFYTRANGVTRYGLSKEAIKNGLIAVPPYNEQLQIAEKLYADNKEIRDMTEKVKAQIEKLKEYRQALIYEAVTGKIDVREMEID
ncbi:MULTISPECIES: restriction endonuclease subunit S [unclassified Exiguobacterium]|uniref:restriction endonuclease subunit S n=1 Tax=unclassified Exiguobacterium TaxID=2644629 RepID=UPI00104085BF|nr:MULTISPECIES: restriction endonuclease subunit S [unclassified Exiguobacterium]TCI67446.1 restriction endonuclease subunit S [Exiguobacterium sp. IPCI3]TCI76784.1 restriction endonuclease subunit S [Exiguobacterium sp. IPCH1]TCI78529.1 restriction endonuclease subunit S [Exiguobacterium sp. IPBC4]